MIMFGISSLKERTFSFVNNASRSLMSELESERVEALKAELALAKADLAPLRSENTALKERLFQLEAGSEKPGQGPLQDLEAIIQEQSATIDRLRTQLDSRQQPDSELD